jgi:hypothetical protein
MNACVQASFPRRAPTAENRVTQPGTDVVIFKGGVRKDIER